MITIFLRSFEEVRPGLFWTLHEHVLNMPNTMHVCISYSNQM